MAATDEAYVQEEYPFVSQVLGRETPALSDEWRGLVYLDHAVISPVSGQGAEVVLFHHLHSHITFPLSPSLYCIACCKRMRPGMRSSPWRISIPETV